MDICTVGKKEYFIWTQEVTIQKGQVQGNGVRGSVWPRSLCVEVLQRRFGGGGMVNIITTSQTPLARKDTDMPRNLVPVRQFGEHWCATRWAFANISSAR